jgi:hypothetical protein
MLPNIKPMSEVLDKDTSNLLVDALNAVMAKTKMHYYVSESTSQVNWDLVPDDIDEANMLILKLYDLRP